MYSGMNQKPVDSLLIKPLHTLLISSMSSKGRSNEDTIKMGGPMPCDPSISYPPVPKLSLACVLVGLVLAKVP